MGCAKSVSMLWRARVLGTQALVASRVNANNEACLLRTLAEARRLSENSALLTIFRNGEESSGTPGLVLCARASCEAALLRAFMLMLVSASNKTSRIPLGSTTDWLHKFDTHNILMRLATETIQRGTNTPFSARV